MQVIITGAAGFVGRAVTDTFLKQGWAVRGIDIKERPQWWPAAEYVQGDVRDADVMHSAVSGADAVIHLAAEPGIVPSIREPRMTADVNVMGLITALDAARQAGVRSFAFASSCATMTAQRSGAMSPYAASKLAGEAYCTAFKETYGLQTSVLRLSNVYGPGSLHKGSAVAGLLKAGLAARELPVTGDGLQRRDFICVQDVARAFWLASQNDKQGTFVIASGESTSILDLARKIALRLDLPESAIVHKEALAGDTRDVHLDSSEARRVLDWGPEVDLEGGLDMTTRWFRKALASAE